MPNSLLKRFAEKSNKPISDVEDSWNKAKQQADEIFKDKPKDSHYWSFVNSKTQESLGLKKK
jgi:hypothetical protein